MSLWRIWWIFQRKHTCATWKTFAHKVVPVQLNCGWFVSTSLLCRLFAGRWRHQLRTLKGNRPRIHMRREVWRKKHIVNTYFFLINKPDLVSYAVILLYKVIWLWFVCHSWCPGDFYKENNKIIIIKTRRGTLQVAKTTYIKVQDN